MAAAEQEKTLAKVAQKAQLPTKQKKEKSAKPKKVIDNGPDGLYIDAEINMPSLTETEQAVMEHLQIGCTLVDDIIAAAGLPAGTVSATLTMLQIKGVVKLLPGNRVERNK